MVTCSAPSPPGGGASETAPSRCHGSAVEPAHRLPDPPGGRDRRARVHLRTQQRAVSGARARAPDPSHRAPRAGADQQGFARDRDPCRQPDPGEQARRVRFGSGAYRLPAVAQPHPAAQDTLRHHRGQPEPAAAVARRRPTCGLGGTAGGGRCATRAVLHPPQGRLRRLRRLRPATAEGPP